MVGFFVEFGVQRHHTTIGVFELAVQPQQFFLATTELLERLQQLAVLLLHLGQH